MRDSIRKEVFNMDKKSVWNDFVENLIDFNVAEYEKTQEYQLRHNRELHIDEMLTTNLTKREKVMVEEVLFELGTASECDAVRLYQQGMKDCVMVLKQLGVI